MIRPSAAFSPSSTLFLCLDPNLAIVAAGNGYFSGSAPERVMSEGTSVFPSAFIYPASCQVASVCLSGFMHVPEDLTELSFLLERLLHSATVVSIMRP